MSKNYDEGSVLTALGRRGIRVDYTNYTRPTLVIPKDGIGIGIHSWGKIDFLVNHCHYGVVQASGIAVNKKDSNKPARKEGVSKRERKSHDLTNKNKRNNKK